MNGVPGRRRSVWGEVNVVRPTVAGAWFLVVLAGLTFGAINTGNNLVYVVLAVMLAVLVVNNVLAEWNLRGLEVRRRLPGEIFAGEVAEGHLLLVNPRSFGAAWQVEVEERDGARARARIGWVGPGSTAEEPARWVFAGRGQTDVRVVRVGSRFPFGLILRYRDMDLPATILVYPRPERGEAIAGEGGSGESMAARAMRGGAGELVGMRAYAPGDPARSIHWPTSARVGRPIVIVRGSEGAGEVVVPVLPGSEGSIRRACGQVLLHTGRGDAVGLDLGAEQLVPRAGDAWRRHILTVLALLPGGVP